VVAQAEDGFSPFDALLDASDHSVGPWSGNDYIPDLDLLKRMLSIPISQGDKQETGRPAKAFDAWVANELRRAGFPADAVFPRTRRPRVLAEGLGGLEERLDELAAQLAEAEKDGARVGPPALRRAVAALARQRLGSSTAYILGDFYAKQIDVGLSAWTRGPDILISTKTMFSAYGKNLKNRHEEAVGEVSSLRRRHPMAAMGYAYLVRQDILNQPSAYATLYDILSRLRRAGETFDATLLLVADWDDDNPAAGVRLIDAPAPELSPSRFFSDIVRCTIDRTPSKVHEEVRRRIGNLPVGGIEPDDDDDVVLEP
jgi:hypothetical protein